MRGGHQSKTPQDEPITMPVIMKRDCLLFKQSMMESIIFPEPERA